MQHIEAKYNVQTLFFPGRPITKSSCMYLEIVDIFNYKENEEFITLVGMFVH